MSESQTLKLIHLDDDCLTAVLQFLSTGSLLCAIHASRRLFSVVGRNRTLIKKHLNTIPGICDDQIDALSNKLLFLTFRRRALRHLYGVESLADCHEYLLGYGTFNTGSSILAMHDDIRSGIKACLVSSSEPLNIRIVTCKGIRENDVVPSFHGQNLRVMCVAHAGTSIAVLYCCEKILRTNDRCPRNDDMPTLSSDAPNSQCFRLVEYDHATNHEICAFELDTDSYNAEEVVPLSMDLNDRREFAILWGRPGYKNNVVTRYTLPVCTSMETGKGSAVEWNCWHDFKAEYVRLVQGSKRLKLYDKSSRMPRWRTSEVFSGVDCDAIDNESVLGSCLCYLDTPFYSIIKKVKPNSSRNIHELSTTLPKNRYKIIRLRLGIFSKPRSSLNPLYLCVCRCKTLVDASQNPFGDKQTDHAAFRDGSDVEVVAQLGVWEQTIRGKKPPEFIAVNAAGSRVAVIRSNDISVCPLEPKVLCKMKSIETGKFYEETPCPATSMRDVARPSCIVLDCNGARAEKLKWNETRENELVVLTDRSIQVWDLGPGASGKRTSEEVFDADMIDPQLVL